VLLTRLGPQEPDPGAWTLPGGGLDWGEDPLGCLAREFLEETSLAVTAIQPLGVYSFQIKSSERIHPGPDVHVIQLVWLVSATGEPVDEVDGSTDQARWWPLERLAEVRLVPVARYGLDLANDLLANRGWREPRPPSG
jgi:8-oxo-dGTP diphosphatase